MPFFFFFTYLKFILAKANAVTEKINDATAWLKELYHIQMERTDLDLLIKKDETGDEFYPIMNSFFVCFNI